MASTYIPLNDFHPAAWHHERALGVGGSEAASLFNEGYGCARRLIMEKRGMEPDFRRTRGEELVLLRGNEMEDTVAKAFVDETGLKVRRQPSRVSKSHPHARVNMDRQIVAVDPAHLAHLVASTEAHTLFAPILDNPGTGALECKTMNSFDFRKLQKEGLVKHNHYILQLQHTLAVTGYLWGIFAILDTTSFELLWFPMLRNDALCEELLHRAEVAWELVMDTSLPLPDALEAGDKRCVKCLHRRTCRGDAYLEKFAGADFSTDYTDVLDPELIEMAADYTDAEETATQASAVVDTIKARLREVMAERNLTKMRVGDVRRFCLASSAGRKTWDGKAIEGEIHAMRKGEISGAVAEELLTKAAEAEVTPAQATAFIASILPAIADRIAHCQKAGAPSVSFRTYAA